MAKMTGTVTVASGAVFEVWEGEASDALNPNPVSDFPPDLDDTIPSWSDWFDGCGAPGKPCTHCGKEGNCRCAE